MANFDESVESVPHPPIVSVEEWRIKRVGLLEKEKELTRQRDRLNAERRRLPMVKVEKDYTFETTEGRKRLLELFDGRRQLLLYHFMFGPDWETGCPGCTSYINAMGDLSSLGERDSVFVLCSRAPLAKLQSYKEEHGWNLPWVSSLGTPFNYDFHVSLDATIAPIEYNYRSAEELLAKDPRANLSGERPGLSVFFRLGNDVYHTYSFYGRGGEGVTDAVSLLDLTPYGRQEDFEDSPEGWPQRPTYG